MVNWASETHGLGMGILPDLSGLSENCKTWMILGCWNIQFGSVREEILESMSRELFVP